MQEALLMNTILELFDAMAMPVATVIGVFGGAI
jgi:hypothetical protein